MRFSLENDRWYACEFISGDMAEESSCFSPIKVLSVEPLGNRQFNLTFHHAAYPEGVREKRYKLNTLERGKKLLLAETTQSGFASYLKIHDITHRWMKKHYPGLDIDGADVQQWLDRNLK